MVGRGCGQEAGLRSAQWGMGTAGTVVALALALAAVGAAAHVVDAHAVALQITAPSDRTLEAYDRLTSLSEYHYGRATTKSNSTAPITITNDAPRQFPMGTTIITWTARQGNEVAVDTQRITRQDTRPPYILEPQCKTFEATGTLTQLSQDDYGVPETRDVSGVRSLTNNAPPAGFPLGITNIKWTATDTLGHSSSKTFCGAYVVDTIAPTLTPPKPHVVKATSSSMSLGTAQFGTATSTDTVTANPTITNDAPDKFPLGDTVITWNATDGSGNYSLARQLVRVIDANVPALAVPPTRIIEATGPTTLPRQSDLGEASATDSVDPNPKITNDLTSALGLGVSNVLWTATDASKNAIWDTQVIAIVDTTPPKITPPGDVLIDSASPVALSSVDIGTATAVDLVDGSVTPTGDAPSTLPLGTTTVTWTAADARGTSASAEQEITVVPSRILRTIQPPSPSEAWAHGFGHKLARSGDLLLVSNTLHAKDGMARAGAVHVYGTGDGALDRTLHYGATAQRANQYFGGSIAAVDGGQVAVGARGYDSSGRFAGSVQVFNPATGAHVRTIENPSAASGGGTGDSFGAFTASLGDKLAVAAHKHDAPGASDAGRVYIYNVSNGALLWTLENPDPDAGDQFGRRLAAFEDSTGEHVYVGSRDHNGKKGAVYAFKVGSTAPAWTATALPGTANTRYAYEAIVPDGLGGVFVGESYIRSGVTWEGRVRHYGPDGALLGTVKPDACCARDFGSRLAVANGLLYAGDRYAVGGGRVTAHGVGDRELAGSFSNPASSSTHFGFALEPLGGTLLAASEHASSATRVHVLDLPSITGIRSAPASGAAGASGASGAVGAAAPAPAALFEPALVSTSLGAGTITLTYDTELDPFEVDIDDYELGGGLTIVSAVASGKTVTIEYIGPASGASGAAGAAGSSGPTAELVGDIGLYARQGGAN